MEIVEQEIIFQLLDVNVFQDFIVLKDNARNVEKTRFTMKEKENVIVLLDLENLKANVQYVQVGRITIQELENVNAAKMNKKQKMVNASDVQQNQFMKMVNADAYLITTQLPMENVEDVQRKVTMQFVKKFILNLIIPRNYSPCKVDLIS